MKYPHIQQHDEKDCGAACLSMICGYYGLKLPIAKFRDLIKVDNMGASIYGVAEGAKEVGLDAHALEGSYHEFVDGIDKGEIEFPLIARIINEHGFEHFIVLYGRKGDCFVTGDPARSGIKKMPADVFREQWQEQIITFAPNQDFTKRNETKGSFIKFFKYITTQKKMLKYVFIMSVLVMLINLSGSLIFQYVVYDVEESVSVGEMLNAPVAEEQECSLDEHGHVHDSEPDLGKTGKIMHVLDKVEKKLDLVFLNLKTVCTGVVILYLLRIFLQVFRGYLLSKTSKLVDVPLTTDYYNSLMDLPAEFYGTRKTGEFMSRFYDTANIRSAVSSATLTLMLDTIMAIGCAAVLCFISVKLFLITFTIMILYAVIMFSFKRPIRNINHGIMEQEAQVTSYLKESIDGIETIKSYHTEKNAKQKLRKIYDDFADKVVRGSVVAIVQESLVEACASIGIVVLLCTGAILCINNDIILADLMTFYYLIGYFLDPVKNLINLQPELQTAFVAAERLNDVLDARREDNDKPAAESLKGDISVQSVDFRYGNRDLVLDKLDMALKSGRKTAIVGKSGCGKTTLAKLLLSFYKPEQGSITINGDNIYDYSPASLRERISYISQNVFLFSDTIYNNIRMDNENISDEQIEEICKKCFADEFIRALPLGYNTTIEESGSNLSGGQKQRIAIARALIRRPDILIMDEATSNLDTITENSIKAMLNELSENITTIIIAHRLNTIKDCDYIYIMEDGHVTEHGTHDSLMRRKGRYFEFVTANE